MKKLLARLARQSPAVIVAMLALFVALTGTAVATTSALITGAQIKNNSITGADIKNKSVTAKDIKGQLRGPRGLRGTPGPKGDKGDKGETGPPGAPNPNAENSDKLDNIDSSGFVQGVGKTYVGRVVTSPGPTNQTVLTVPGFARMRTLNCQAGGANVSLVEFDQARGTFTGWRETGADDPGYASSPGLVAWNSEFKATERTTWHFSVGTGANAEVARIEVYTHADGSYCFYSATAQVWGR